MYTRSYYQENRGGVPKDYDGNAFRSDDVATLVTPTYGETKISPEYMAEEKTEEYAEAGGVFESEAHTDKDGFFSKIISGIPFKKLPFGLGDIFGKSGGIDLEEIVIIAVGLLLLFSGEGDKLLGIALLALLFIK